MSTVSLNNLSNIQTHQYVIIGINSSKVVYNKILLPYEIPEVDHEQQI